MKYFCFVISLLISGSNQLTTLMVTHSMQQALKLGSRTIMLHQGQIVYDVAGIERQQLTITDLLNKFGDAVNDEMILG